MKRLYLPFLACLSLLTACAPQRDVEPSAHAPDFQRGMRVYQAHCAACHDTGRQGAPTLDDPEEWDERALAWQSLMRDHARRGFMNMPPKGGEPRLRAGEIRDALYYMDIKIRANED